MADSSNYHPTNYSADVFHTLDYLPPCLTAERRIIFAQPGPQNIRTAYSTTGTFTISTKL